MVKFGLELQMHENGIVLVLVEYDLLSENRLFFKEKLIFH